MSDIEQKSLQGKTVLVVDDEPDIQDVMKLDFQWLGCQVLVASGGHEAMTILQQHPVDIVISDVRMDHGDGLSLLKWVRKNLYKHPLFLLVSAYPDLTEPEARNMGALTILTKPYKFDFISQLLAKAVTHTDYSLSS